MFRFAASAENMMSLRTLLVGFALLCAAPVLLLSILQMRSESARLNGGALERATIAADRLQGRLDRALASAESTAYLIGGLDLSSEAARRDCSAVLARSIPTADAYVRNYVVVSPQGDVVCSAQKPLHPVNGLDRPHVRQALQLKRPTLSGHVVGRVTGEDALQLVVPNIDRDGEVVSLGVAAFSAASLTARLIESGPVSFAVAVLDREGVLVSRFPHDPALPPGTPLATTELFQAAIGSAGDRTAQLRDTDGRNRHYVFRPVDFHGETLLWVASGVDVAAVANTARDARVRDLVLALLLAGGVCTVAALTAGPLVRARCRRMLEVAQQIAQGRYGLRVPVKLKDELTPVEVALNHMLDAVEADRTVLQESESRYRLLFENSLDGVLETTPDGGIRAANPTACAMLGRSEAELCALGRDGVVDPTDPRLAQLLQQRRERGSSSGELTLVRSDGGRLEAEVTSSSYRDRLGNEVNCLVIRDLTERKLAQLQLVQLNRDLEERVRSRTAELAAAVHDLEAFTYSASHDLRAPLQTIDGFARKLQADFGQLMPPSGAHYLERIRAGARKLGVLIDDLLAFARMSRQDTRMRVCDMAQLVGEALDELAPAFPGRTAQVRIGELPSCVADASLMRQVWINLLGNALKYSAKKAQPAIEAGCERQQDEQVYFVRDNGAGFDMAYADKLFGVFQRLHPDSEFEGTGVGLAIVKRIVERHQGRVWAEAVANQGAAFYFTLGSSGES